MLYRLGVQTYKVAVWATGGVGRFAIRTVVDRPTLELVGAWVHSVYKDGADVGTLAGIAPVGVRASRDEAVVLDGDADCVVYAAPAGSRPKEALADLCRILAAGKTDPLHQCKQSNQNDSGHVEK